MFLFSPQVQKVLEEAGWSPSRSVPVTEWIKNLTDVGYKPFPLAIAILENLGGLEITPPTNQSNLFFPCKIVFDPVYAASSEFDRIKKWQEEHGLWLFPLGEYDPLFILMCSSGGRIFGGRESRFDLLGDSIEDALELRIFASRRPIPHVKA